MRNSYLLSFIALALGLPLSAAGAAEPGSKAEPATAAGYAVQGTQRDAACAALSAAAGERGADPAP